MSEFVLPKRVVKSRIDSQVFSGSHASVMCPIRSCILFDLYTRLLYVLQPKDFIIVQPSLLPYFDFTLLNVYRNTGIK